MTDKQLKRYFKALPEDLREKYSEFAAPQKADADGGRIRGGAAVRNTLLAAGLTAAGAVAAVICVFVLNNRRLPDDPAVISGTDSAAVSASLTAPESSVPSAAPEISTPPVTPENSAPPVTPENSAPLTTETPTETPELQPTPLSTEIPPEEPTAEPTLLPLRFREYNEWLKWREENPEEYSEWKQLPMPETNVAEQREKMSEAEWLERCDDRLSEYSDNGKSRFWIDLNESLLEVIPKDIYDQSFISSCPSDPLSLPKTIVWLRHFNITKDDLTEYVKWKRLYRPGACGVFDLTVDEIELIYSDDTRKIRDHFKSPYYTFCYDDLIFIQSELNRLSLFDLGRMFPEGSSDASILSEKTRANLPLAREEYDRIKTRDAGGLTLDAAEEMIGEFLVLYSEIRLSPDEHAGELIKNIPKYAVWYDRFGEYAILKDSAELADIFNRVQRSVFPFGFPAFYLQIMKSGQIVETPADWLDNLVLISLDSKFYRGEIVPFDDEYTLADHINIVYTDNEDAYVELTARKRDGSGEATYTVNFEKSYERWRVTGGTLLDLITVIPAG